MKALAWLLLSGVCGYADEDADRTAINGAIAALNQIPQRRDLFTPDADGLAVLNQLRSGRRLAYRRPGVPTVIISHEPWGEATIDYGGAGEILNPKIVSRTIRFITPDVALTDGVCNYEDDSAVTQTPLLFIMKKDEGRWRIASLRVLASH